MQIYISGPMTGYEDFNYPMFYEAEDAVRLGWPDAFIINPASMDEEYGLPQGITEADLGSAKSHAAFMRRDLPLVAQSEAIVLLPGWSTSSGAVYEFAVAMACGLSFYAYSPPDLFAIHDPQLTLLPDAAKFMQLTYNHPPFTVSFK